MTTFADLGLSDSVLAAVEALGYTEPTPVQAQSIPLALEGRDMIAAAKTGTGKTAAFSLPSLDRLERSDRKKAPTMLVITRVASWPCRSRRSAAPSRRPAACGWPTSWAA